MTSTEYFIEIIGDEPEDITSVLVGCIPCGHRELGLTVAGAKEWRSGHHREYHEGPFTMEFLEDDPYNEKGRYSRTYEDRPSPAKDLVLTVVKDEWVCVPDIAVLLDKKESGIRNILYHLEKSGTILKKEFPMPDRKPQVRFMAA